MGPITAVEMFRNVVTYKERFSLADLHLKEGMDYKDICDILTEICQLIFLVSDSVGKAQIETLSFSINMFI